MIGACACRGSPPPGSLLVLVGGRACSTGCRVTAPRLAAVARLVRRSTLVPIAFGLLVATAPAGQPDRLAAARRTAPCSPLMGVRRRVRALRRARPPGRAAGRRVGGRWSSDRGWPLLFAGVTAIAWVFPDGRLPSPRWRPWAIGAALSFAGLIVCTAARGRAVQRAVRRTSPRPLPRPADERDRGAARGLRGSARSARLVGAVARRAVPAPPRLRDRAPAAAVARLRRRRSSPLAVAICLLEVAVTGEDGPDRAGGRDLRAHGGPGRRSASRSCATGSTRSTA